MATIKLGNLYHESTTLPNSETNPVNTKDVNLETELTAVKNELTLVKTELQTIKANQLSGDQKVTLSGTIASVTIGGVDYPTKWVIDDTDPENPVAVLGIADVGMLAYNAGNDTLKIDPNEMQIVSMGNYINQVVEPGDTYTLGIFPVLRKKAKVYFVGYSADSWKIKVSMYAIAGVYGNWSSDIIIDAELELDPSFTTSSDLLITSDIPLTGAEFKIDVTHTHGSSRKVTAARVIQFG